MSSQKSCKSKSTNNIAPETAKMNKIQLESLIQRLCNERQELKQEKATLEIEKDELRTYCNLTCQELEGVRDRIKEKDRVLQECAEQHLQEIKHYQQQVRMYEIDEYGNKLKGDFQRFRKQAGDKHRADMEALLARVPEQVQKERILQQQVEALAKLEESPRLNRKRFVLNV